MPRRIRLLRNSKLSLDQKLLVPERRRLRAVTSCANRGSFCIIFCSQGLHSKQLYKQQSASYCSSDSGQALFGCVAAVSAGCVCLLTVLALATKVSHMFWPMKLRKALLVSWYSSELNSKSRLQLTLAECSPSAAMSHTDCRRCSGWSVQSEVIVHRFGCSAIRTCELQLISPRSWKLIVSCV